MIISALKKSYSGRTVLNTPELELKDGCVYAVVGSNGSGKSTFARLIAGVERDDSGKTATVDVSVGYMPQKNFAFRMSVRANLLLSGGDNTRAEALMRSLTIESLADKPAHKLSGGETARMALARLLMHDYGLLILDEPTAAMDMESTVLAERLIAERGTSGGCTVLLVTHSLQQARRLADYALFLERGELIESGEAGRVLYSPANAKTRDFLNFYGA